jgi:Spy/CpxP family protein refolding chaperone
MKKTIAMVLAALLLLMAVSFTAMADDDEADDEEEGALGNGENEADEDGSQSMPGFEIALTTLGILFASRFINRS